MEKDLISFIKKNNIGLFNEPETIRREAKNIFKTKDAKLVFSKTLDIISESFSLSNTSNLLSYFEFTQDKAEIIKRQEFFKKIIALKKDSAFLKQLKTPESKWVPDYDITVVTSNEKTFIELKKLGIPAKFVTTEEDVKYLESADIIQVIDAEEVETFLDQLPQTLSINNIEDVYLERYLEIVAGWKKNIEILKSNESNLTEDIVELINKLQQLLVLTENKKREKLTKQLVDEKVSEINESLFDKIKTLNFSGEVLVKILSGNSLPKEVSEIVEKELEANNLPEEVITLGIPLKIDERELARYLKEQDSNEFVNSSAKIKKYSVELKKVPLTLEELEQKLILLDFYSGINKFSKDNKEFSIINSELEIKNSKNIFLREAQPISFKLNNEFRCSILTGANSGGKTTLLEHLIQIITISQIGLPINEKISIPLFTDVYYFAKNKGSLSKGAFETLLNQMAEITPGEQTIILADEIESVTEPGVAGKILCATADYFITRNCFVIIATHLGREIKNNLPRKARIDGIEAKGLDENDELIVDHNPVLGKLANSTPELIVEKMARKQPSDYIKFISEYVKKN